MPFALRTARAIIVALAGCDGRYGGPLALYAYYWQLTSRYILLEPGTPRNTAQLTTGQILL